jgi:predicted NBD/HSP70 family sugar kinase
MARLRSGSGALSRDLNRAAILELIGRHNAIARVEIARELDLSPATVTVLTRDLVQDGLVREVDLAPSNGGRPAILLGLVADAAHALGVKIAANRLTAVHVNLQGEPLEYTERSFDAAGPDAIDRLGDELAEILGPRDASTPRLLGVGLGVPGTVDPLSGGIVESPVLGWRELPLGSRLQERLGVPILVENDVNTLAVAERLYGRGRTVDHFITVTIGRGVGLGIVVGGDLYRGARGGAGEFGHVRMVDDGPLCNCGNRGCLEALVSDPVLVDQARAVGLLGATDGIDQLRVLADRGDETARSLYTRAGETLGRAVAGLVNILSPELVLLSGEGTQAWSHLQASFEATLRPDLFEPLRHVAVEVDPWDDAKWARGAAALVMRATFAAPLYERHADDAVRARLTAVAGAPAQGAA